MSEAPGKSPGEAGRKMRAVGMRAKKKMKRTKKKRRFPPRRTDEDAREHGEDRDESAEELLENDEGHKMRKMMKMTMKRVNWVWKNIPRMGWGTGENEKENEKEN